MLREKNHCVCVTERALSLNSARQYHLLEFKFREKISCFFLKINEAPGKIF